MLKTRKGMSQFFVLALSAIVACVSLVFMNAHAGTNATVVSNHIQQAVIPVAGEEAEKANAMKIVGPDKGDNNCATCHALEVDAWKETHHYKTYKTTHREDAAKEILSAMGERSMKYSVHCRQCHYTTIIKRDRIYPQWGISCESCHSAGKEWVEMHQKQGGDASKENLVWGAGKKEAAADRNARRAAASKKGMIHSEMIYDIATNCYGCHTVPNETLVNKSEHAAGSEFDLVAWSQGEVRHNFASSSGAPDNPTNRKVSAEQLRRLYVVGAMVDLEFSLRNLANVKEKGGKFHKAMVARVNKARTKVDAMLAKVEIAGLAAPVKAVPATVDESTDIDSKLADALGTAAKAFAADNDGSKLGAIGELIPKEYRGEAFSPAK